MTLTYKTYKRTRLVFILFVYIGFGLLSVGALTEGLRIELLKMDHLFAHAIKATIAVTAFIIIFYSIKMTG